MWMFRCFKRPPPENWHRHVYNITSVYVANVAVLLILHVNTLNLFHKMNEIKSIGIRNRMLCSGCQYHWTIVRTKGSTRQYFTKKKLVDTSNFQILKPPSKNSSSLQLEESANNFPLWRIPKFAIFYMLSKRKNVRHIENGYTTMAIPEVVLLSFSGFLVPLMIVLETEIFQGLLLPDCHQNIRRGNREGLVAEIDMDLTTICNMKPREVFYLMTHFQSTKDCSECSPCRHSRTKISFLSPLSVSISKWRIMERMPIWRRRKGERRKREVRGFAGSENGSTRKVSKKKSKKFKGEWTPLKKLLTILLIPSPNKLPSWELLKCSQTHQMQSPGQLALAVRFEPVLNWKRLWSPPRWNPKLDGLYSRIIDPR